VVRVFRSPWGIGVDLGSGMGSKVGLNLRPLIHVVRVDLVMVFTSLYQKYLQVYPLSCRIGKLFRLPISWREEVKIWKLISISC